MPDRFSELAPDQQAVLSLLIRQGRHYEQVAAMLGIPAETVRGRAHGALADLAPPAGLPDAQLGQVSDYLLGQADEAARIETLSALLDSPSARAWAAQVAAQLRPHATVPLPEVPDVPDTAPPPRRRRPAPAPGAPAPRRSPARSGSGPDRGVAVLAAAALLLVAAIVVFLSAGPSAAPPVGPVPAGASTLTSTTAAGTTVTSAAGSPQILDTLRLAPVATGSQAAGVVVVVKTSSGDDLVFTGSGLPAPGSRHYVLWLYKSASDYKALGLVPNVTGGKVGPVQIALPADASQYTGVLLTLVSGATPASAGSVVLLGNGSSAL